MYITTWVLHWLQELITITSSLRFTHHLNTLFDGQVCAFPASTMIRHTRNCIHHFLLLHKINDEPICVSFRTLGDENEKAWREKSEANKAELLASLKMCLIWSVCTVWFTEIKDILSACTRVENVKSISNINIQTDDFLTMQCVWTMINNFLEKRK